NNNGIFDSGVDDWPKNKHGAASGETVWWENDSTYDNKNHYISQLGLGASDGDESQPWNSNDDRTNHLFSGTVGEIQTNPANALTTKLTLRVEADSIFQINATYTPLDEPTNDKTIEGVNGNDINLESVGIGITLIDASIDSLDNARAAIGFLDNEIDNLSQQMATIGSNLAELEVASERMRNHVFLSQMGIDRLSDDTLVHESTNYAKEQIRTQASSALVTQAFSISEKVLNFIL
ncbi:MAG: flagellin, partial [Verrucomicrobiota bacterium]|nr:flagellin [Verrucomicrobiota bacterium]